MGDIPKEELNEYALKFCPNCEEKERCSGTAKDLYRCFSDKLPN